MIAGLGLIEPLRRIAMAHFNEHWRRLGVKAADRATHRYTAK